MKKDAPDEEVVKSGKRAILFAFISGVTIGIVLLYLKFSNPDAAFTHTLNELRYYINCAIVVLICAAVFLIAPKHKVAFLAFFATIALQFVFKAAFPEMNYFIRAMWVILCGFLVILIGSMTRFTSWSGLFRPATKSITQFGIGMLASLVLLHVVFH